MCSFFARGECTRGVYCPYRHELIEENELSQQNLKDRYYGVNDPVAEKILRGLDGEAGKKYGAPDPPADMSVRTLFVGGLTSLITEAELRERFGASGEIAGVRMIADKGIAFVEMRSRQGAEAAVQALHGRLNVSGARLSVKWAKPQKGRDADGAGDSLAPIHGIEGSRLTDAASLLPQQGMPAHNGAAASSSSSAPLARDARGNPVGTFVPPPGYPGAAAGSYGQVPPPGKVAKKAKSTKAPSLPPAYYPSQDPNQLGSSAGRTPKTAGHEREAVRKS